MGVWTAVYSIQDGKGETSTTEINLPGNLVLLSAQEAAGALGVLIQAMIGGVITRVSLQYAVTYDNGGISPAQFSDVEEGARFQFRTQGGFYTALRIPTFDESRITSGGKNVDMTNADVAAFVDAMVDGVNVSLGLVQPCDKRGDNIAALSFAREQFLSSR